MKLMFAPWQLAEFVLATSRSPGKRLRIDPAEVGVDLVI
jgi:hypothetical protein